MLLRLKLGILIFIISISLFEIAHSCARRRRSRSYRGKFSAIISCIYSMYCLFMCFSTNVWPVAWPNVRTVPKMTVKFYRIQHHTNSLIHIFHKWSEIWILRFECCLWGGKLEISAWNQSSPSPGQHSWTKVLRQVCTFGALLKR